MNSQTICVEYHIFETENHLPSVKNSLGKYADSRQILKTAQDGWNIKKYCEISEISEISEINDISEINETRDIRKTSKRKKSDDAISPKFAKFIKFAKFGSKITYTINIAKLNSNSIMHLKK